MKETINPTRMELIKIKTRIKLASKGHQLLKKKRDVLVLEFMDILNRSKFIREKLNEQMAEAYASLAIASAYHNIFDLENAILAVKKVSGISVKVKNAMGVKIPILKKTTVKKPWGERGYSVIGTSAKIDAATKNFEEALAIIVELAESEDALKKLIREIEKIKRRVNALEEVILPTLRRHAKIITLRLDEMERESFFTLKLIKDQMAAAEEAEAQAG
ncbi:MAG: V-type ATP synthase subunit D [Candidatus Altiarchaeota archaeon]